MDREEIEKLRLWFLEEQRPLPWRGEEGQVLDPYAVWISEIMLQQTQVSVVIPYFHRWMQRFPSVHALANASIEEVIKLWEGLGYYSRARNIHSAAKRIVDHFQGIFPKDEESIRSLPGLGPYTVGAIRAFAFQQKAAAIDGNVLRVMARLFAIKEPVDKRSGYQTIAQLAQDLLPDDRPWQIAEALIELGAKVCQRQAKCGLCPLKQSCLAYKLGLQNQLPLKAGKIVYQKLYRQVAVISAEGHYLVRQQEDKLMQGLYEFPYIEGQQVMAKEENHPPCPSLLSHLDSWNLALDHQRSLKVVRHSFTRFRVLLYPHLFLAKRRLRIEGYSWKSPSELSLLPFSSGHRRILLSLI